MENDIQILPVLDVKALQEKANEFAMKGATEAIKEFYSGYNSPYKEQIEAHLKKTEINTCVDLPDIIAVINEQLSAEIDKIANTAIAKSFMPLVQRFLVRADKEVKFSDILKAFINSTEAKYNECEVSITESKHEWLEVTLTSEERSYSLCLHIDYSSKKEAIRKYNLLSLPNDAMNTSSYKPTMRLSLDNGYSLEMPFTKDILKDDFNAYIARLVIGNCNITMDCRDFDEDMFPNNHFHCD